VADLAATQTSFVQSVDQLSTGYRELRNELGAVNAHFGARDFSFERAIDTAILASEARQATNIERAINTAVRASEDCQESVRAALSTRLTNELRTAVACRTPPFLPAPSPMDMRLSSSPSVQSASSDGRRPK
jgi:hypothetical protein